VTRFLTALVLTAAVISSSAAAQISVSTRPDASGSRTRLARYSLVARGNQIIAAGTVSRGSVLVINGNLDVYGDIAGAATALGGDIAVHDGGRIRGAAVAIFGTVRNEGGSILGVVKEVGRHGATARLAFGGRPPSTFRSLRTAIGWLVALLLLGGWALFFAGDYLKRVVTTVSNEMNRSFITGLLSGLSTLPLLMALVVAMAITLIGIIFIPIGVFGFFIVVFGIGVFGFLAVAQVTGIAISRESKGTETPAGNELRHLVTGILAYSALWIVAAAFTWFPVVGTVLRVLAASVTFVAVMTGFGAVIISLWRLRKERKAVTA
jgi:hypothetical protein